MKTLMAMTDKELAATKEREVKKMKSLERRARNLFGHAIGLKDNLDWRLCASQISTIDGIMATRAT